MAKSQGRSSREELEQSLLSLLREAGDALEAASPPFDTAAVAARLRDVAEGEGLLRSDGSPAAELRDTGAELEEAAPPFDVEAGAARLRGAALARGLMPASESADSGLAASLVTSSAERQRLRGIVGAADVEMHARTTHRKDRPALIAGRGMVVVEPPVATLGGLLRQLRAEAGLTQEELAAVAGLSARTVSDLERGVTSTARKETARRLASALRLAGPARDSFEAAARGRAPAGAFAASGTRVGGVAAATRILPRDIASFTGRKPELRQLVGVAAGAPSSGGVMGIHAIGGMPGVGKTAFAVHAAHQLAPRFPDGQIFLSLHGHTPGQRPVDPADALASLLLTAGVSVSQIPPGIEARMALWRDRLAGRQLLLVLDDAVDSEQVRPLLPGTAGSLVLVTSRRHLTALEDADAISLDTLSPGEAAQLLVRLAPRADLSAGDPAVAEITRLCGYLPLAVGMLARQLHHHPAWTAAGLAEELAAARDRPALMHAETLSVAAAFDVSYQELTPDQQRLFRRLGLHPGADFDAYAAASLDGTGLAEARHDLDALYEQYLITEPVRDRYRFHDLIREHARGLAALDELAERDAATGALLDYYQHTAVIAEARLARQTRPGPAPALATPPAAVPDLTGSGRALAWARAERANLLACLDHATWTGQHARVVALTAAMAALLRHDGPRTDAITRHAVAATAAQRLGDRLAQANALNDLGDVRRLAGDYRGAAQALEEALGIYRDLGDRLGQANALNNLGIVRQQTGDYPAAAQALPQALGIYRDLGDRLGQANALNQLGILRQLTGEFSAAAQPLEEALGISIDLGDRLGQANALVYLGYVRRMTGDYRGAAQALEEALGTYHSLGDRGGEAEALNEAGELHRVSGDLTQAEGCHQQALELARAIASPWDEAQALAGLGRCALAHGDATQAEDLLQQACEIFQQISAAEAPGVGAELDAMSWFS